MHVKPKKKDQGSLLFFVPNIEKIIFAYVTQIFSIILYSSE